MNYFLCLIVGLNLLNGLLVFEQRRTLKERMMEQIKRKRKRELHMVIWLERMPWNKWKTIMSAVERKRTSISKVKRSQKSRKESKMSSRKLLRKKIRTLKMLMGYSHRRRKQRSRLRMKIRNMRSSWKKLKTRRKRLKRVKKMIWKYWRISGEMKPNSMRRINFSGSTSWLKGKKAEYNFYKDVMRVKSYDSKGLTIC